MEKNALFYLLTLYQTSFVIFSLLAWEHQVILLLLYSLYFLKMEYTGHNFSCITMKLYDHIQYLYFFNKVTISIQLISVGVHGLAVLFLYAVFSFFFYTSFMIVKNYCFICGIDNDTFERHQQAELTIVK